MECSVVSTEAFRYLEPLRIFFPKHSFSPNYCLIRGISGSVKNISIFLNELLECRYGMSYRIANEERGLPSV